MTSLHDFRRALDTTVSSIKHKRDHLRLVLETITLNNIRRTYPCITIVWLDEYLRSTLISVDLIPVTIFKDTVRGSFPNHNFLPIIQEQHMISENHKSPQNAKKEEADNYDRSPPSIRKISPCLFSIIDQNP